MTQKTLNKMGKYCKLEKMPFGQLIHIVLEYDPTWGENLRFIPDEDFEKAFNKFYKQFPPKVPRGGYYPKGHKK